MSDAIACVSDDVAAGEVPAAVEEAKASLPVRKRKEEKDASTAAAAEGGKDLKPLKRGPMSKAREIRLEQNRKAARESRRRKKNMIDELQRSVVFFSRANSTLKQQNDELTRLLLQAQAQVNAAESGQKLGAVKTEQVQPVAQQPVQQGDVQQAQAQAVAQHAKFETQGFPSAAARTAAQTMNAGSTASGTSTPAASTTSAPYTQESQTFPAMQTIPTGSTMQAMANFQQAAAAAMASAMGMSAQVSGQQQAYNDAMNAIVMQQAAAAAAGQQFPFLQFPGMQQQFPVAMASQPAAGAVDAYQQQQPQQQEQQATESQQG